MFLKSSEDVLFWNKVVRLLAGAWSPSSCLSASSLTRQERLQCTWDDEPTLSFLRVSFLSTAMPARGLFYFSTVTLEPLTFVSVSDLVHRGLLTQ